MIIKVSYPQIGIEEEKEVLSALRSGQIAQGDKVKEFENNFKEYLRAPYAVAVSSGTAALHLACLSLNLKTGDEVITTPFSFIASTNAIVFTGAKPVFADIDSDYNLNPNLIEEKITPNTKAILVVHLFGLPAKMERICQIAKKHNLKVIEDAAQAHGAKTGNQYAGTFGDLGCFSFYATKNITTAEGGIVVSKDESLIKKIQILRNHGATEKYYHPYLGYNYRMSDLHAAIGIAQLKKLDGFNKKRIENALFLNNLLKVAKSIKTPTVEKNFTHVFHQYSIEIKPPLKREVVVNHLRNTGIETSIVYPTPIHKQPLYSKLYGKEKLPKAEALSSMVLSLPIHPGLNKDELESIAKSVLEVEQ